MATTYVDEATGEHLATVFRSGTKFRVQLSRTLDALLRECSARDDIPTEITHSAFYDHYYRDEGRTIVRSPVAFVSDAQCSSALSTLPRLAAAARHFVDEE